MVDERAQGKFAPKPRSRLQPNPVDSARERAYESNDLSFKPLKCRPSLTKTGVSLRTGELSQNGLSNISSRGSSPRWANMGPMM
jgi:hypothetical protein